MSVIYGAQAGQGGSHDLQDGPEGIVCKQNPDAPGVRWEPRRTDASWQVSGSKDIVILRCCLS